MRMSTVSRRRWVMGVGVGLATGLAVVSVAWACTVQMSQMTISPTSGYPGTSVSANNSTASVPLKAAAWYKLRFNNANRVSQTASCHSAPYTMKTFQADATGRFKVTAPIPSTYVDAPKGMSQICATETSPVSGATATTHQSFTVL